MDTVTKAMAIIGGASVLITLIIVIYTAYSDKKDRAEAVKNREKGTSY